uniref:Uncharacterized protein n=1 Tax=Tanacetum cinerariifolium TaxID=118510 RepID=A0A6L2K7S8_TANCI|nr:hypothetical protein [Tanacetum cinerariifolium]
MQDDKLVEQELRLTCARMGRNGVFRKLDLKDVWCWKVFVYKEVTRRHLEALAHKGDDGGACEVLGWLLGRVTPLFPSMLAQAAVEEGEGSGKPIGPQPTPSLAQPSLGDQTHETSSSSSPENTQSPRIVLEGTGGLEEDQKMEHTPNASVQEASISIAGIVNTLVNIANVRLRPVVITDPEQEQRRATLIVQPAIDPKDKGKGKMVEPEPKKKNSRKGILMLLRLLEIKSDKGVDNTEKRKARSRMKRMSKRQKTDADLEEEEQLRDFLNIIPDEEGEVDYAVLDKRYPIVDSKSEFYYNDRYGKPHDYYRVFRADGSSRYIKNFTEMASKFDRLDFIELHSLVMQRFEITTPEVIDLILWRDLRIMFKESADDDLWKNQEEWILKSWNFYENYRVHILMLEDGTEFYMLAERRYLLIKETLKRMMALRLIA